MMNIKFLRLFCLAVLILSMMYQEPDSTDALSTAFPPVKLIISSVVDSGNTCGTVDNSLYVSVQLASGSLLGTIDDGSGEDKYMIAVFDGDGHHIANYINSLTVNFTGTFSFSAQNFGSITSIVPPTARPFQARLIDTPNISDVNVPSYIGNAPLLATTGYNPASASSACAALPDRSLPPALIAPVHKQHTGSNPNFSWTPMAGATTYRLLILDADTGAEVFKKVVTGTSYTMTTPLPAGKYVWRVRTKVDALGIFGKWSQRNTLFID